MNARIAIFFAAVALFAVPSFAQMDVYPREVSTEDGGGGGWSDSGTYSLGEYVDNPCTALQDWVWVTYDVSLYQEGELLGSSERVLFAESTTVSGDYSAAGSSESDVVYKQQPYTLRKYYKVNTWDDFHLVTVIDFDPATNYTTVTKETACGNGMPDSAQ